MLKYSGLSLDDLDSMHDLYYECLNSSDNLRDWIRLGLENPRYAGVKCTDENTVAGVFSGRPGVEFTCGHEDIVELIMEKYKGRDLFCCDMVVVAPEYRGKGIGRELSNRLRDSLLQNGCETFIIEAWYRPLVNDVPASGLLKYFGEPEVFGEYPDFYKDAYKSGISCPDCGDGECRCGSVIYISNLV